MRHTWVEDFYGAFLTTPPTVDPGCELSRLQGHAVLGVATSPGHHVAAAGACAPRPPFLTTAGQRTSLRALVFLRRRVSPLSPASREPKNVATLYAAAGRLCALAGLTCMLGVALEDLSWREQLLTARRTEALVGYHGSGIGASALWMPAGSTVLEFTPPRCWWCAFASGTTRQNCSAGTAPRTRHAFNVGRAHTTPLRITWLLSTTADTPNAVLQGEGVNPAVAHWGCANGGDFEHFRDVQRRVGLRSLRRDGALAAALGLLRRHGKFTRRRGPAGVRSTARASDGLRTSMYRWARAQRRLHRPRVLLDACGGSAVQVYET